MSSQGMSEDLFWEIIARLDWDKTGDDDQVLQPAVDALAALPEADIFEFDEILNEKLYALDTREHARHVYEGEVDPDDGDEYISADDFLYKRCVVVANGRELYEAALGDPSQMPKDLEFEALIYVPGRAYEQKTGAEYDHATRLSFESFSNKDGWKPTAQTKPGKFTGPDIPPGNRRPT
jgi:hypothetical protein